MPSVPHLGACGQVADFYGQVAEKGTKAQAHQVLGVYKRMNCTQMGFPVLPNKD